ncbi:LPXTG cell wall anchor domain-containing protein, partial [Streptococcus uberis]
SVSESVSESVSGSQSEQQSESSSNKSLPNTGSNDSRDTGLFGAGLLFAAGLLGKRRKKKGNQD